MTYDCCVQLAFDLYGEMWVEKCHIVPARRNGWVIRVLQLLGE